MKSPESVPMSRKLRSIAVLCCLVGSADVRAQQSAVIAITHVNVVDVEAGVTSSLGPLSGPFNPPPKLPLDFRPPLLKYQHR